MTFDNDKVNILHKLDKSKKGSIDTPILELVQKINAADNFYSTSTCSGRIVLIEVNEKKNETNWLLQSHDPVTVDQLKRALVSDKEVWLKMEPLILHVCCRSINNARDLLIKARSIGIKRGGIFSISPKIMVELQSTEQIDLVIMKESKVLVDDSYLHIMVQDSNKKLKRTKEKIKKLQLLL